MFTDIVGSTNLVEALGDEAWESLLQWHDQTLRALFAAHQGEEVVATGDGFFVGFDCPEAAIACAVAIQRRLAEHRQQHGFAPQVRIGLHASDATQVGTELPGQGRPRGRADRRDRRGRRDPGQRGDRRRDPGYVRGAAEVSLKGITEPVDVVSIDWR